MTLIRSRRLGPLSRRTVLQTALAAPFGALLGQAPAVRKPRPTDIRIVEVTHAFEDFKYRAPYQFGGRTVDDVSLLNVQLPRAHGQRTRGVGFRVDAARQRVGVSGGPLRDRPWRDAGAGRRGPQADRRLRRGGASGRPGTRARSSVCEGRQRAGAVEVAALPDTAARGAGRLERVRRGAPRRVRQGVRRQLVRDLRVEIHEPRSVTRSGQGVQGRVSRSLRAGASAADDAGVSFRRRERPAGTGRREDEAGRRAAQYARGVDPSRRA